jgi:hypothetical protein
VYKRQLHIITYQLENKVKITIKIIFLKMALIHH